MGDSDWLMLIPFYTLGMIGIIYLGFEMALWLINFIQQKLSKNPYE
ncbi:MULTISPECIES: hypothetical protein [unclassified Moraxella]